ncbi:MAG: division/cell wall cluster transcriptional repressor MraZ [Clostridia bacterium]|nr:division/cell wall cluster transcriptional repressor MraZ [Clostridia bacterium]
MVGTYEHNVDSKNRIIIPAKFREALGEAFYLTIGYDRCIRAYSEEEFDRYKRHIDEAPEEDDNVRELRRFLYAFTEHCELDKQGRVVLPPRLKAFGGIDGEVVIVGQSLYAEIWAKENWTWDFNFEDNNPNKLLSAIAKYKNPPVANS